MSSRNALPGFNLSLGYTLTWLSLIVLTRKFHRPSTAPEFSAGKMDKRPGRGYLLKSWAFLWIQDELPPTPDAQRVGDAR